MLLLKMFSILALLLNLLLYHQVDLQSLLLFFHFEYLLHHLSQTKFMYKKQQQPNKTTQIVKTSFQLRLLVLILKAKHSNYKVQSYLLLKR